MKNILQEISETKEKLKKSSRRDPDYNRLSQLIEEKHELLNSVVGIVDPRKQPVTADLIGQWGLDDEVQLYCQMMFNASDSSRAQELILDRLIGLGRTKEYWKLVKSLQAKPSGRQRYSSCLLYTSPSPRDQRGSRMPSSA